MNLNDWAKEIHELAVSKGWWDGERDIAEVVALIHSELSEALEEYRNGKPMVYNVDGKPEGIAVELADCVIRILDYCGFKNYDINKSVGKHSLTHDKINTFMQKPIALLVADCHYEISLAYRMGHRGEKIWPHLSRCVLMVLYRLKGEGIELETIMRIKHEYNKTRPHRHGGKVC